MSQPPVTLFHPSYVVEYAIVDNSVQYTDRKTLNVGGKWLGAVPKLAICKNIEDDEYILAHCDNDWDLLCSVERHKTIRESKENAEKHYIGINKKWIKTNYMEAQALEIFSQEKENMKCSFCGASHYDGIFTSLVTGKNANICNICIQSINEDLCNEGS